MLPLQLQAQITYSRARIWKVPTKAAKFTGRVNDRTIGIWMTQHVQEGNHIETERFVSAASSAKQIRKKNKGKMEDQRRGDEGHREESGRKDRGDAGGEFDRNEIRSARSRSAAKLRSQLNSPDILTTFNSLELRRRISDL